MNHLPLVALACAALPGCAVQLYGNQASGAGASATATGSQVAVSSAGANARVSLFSGQPVSPSAPGGQVRIGGGSATGLLAAAVVFGELLNDIAAAARPRPLATDTRISHTCSCYGYRPPAAEE